MGRVREAIKVDGRECWTLFDTGARHTYVVPEVAKLLTTRLLDEPFRSAIGGGTKETRIWALLEARVEGHRIVTDAVVVDEIGKDEDGRPIEVLFGAIAMQQWGIRPVPDEERLDLTHYSETFVEF